MNSKMDETYGLVCYETDFAVVRAKVREDGKLQVTVHPKACGRERIPGGYVLGSNMLQYKSPSQETVDA